MKRRESFLMKMVAFILIVFVIVYMGYHVISAFRNPLQTVGAVIFTVEDSVPTNGYFIRDEVLIPYPDDVEIGSDIAEAYVEDGARVAKDDTVFLIYGDQSALTQGARLRVLERRISDMRYAREQIAGAMDAAHMDVLIYQRLADMLDMRDRRRQASFNDSALEFKSMVFKREYTYGENVDLGGTIESLELQAEAIRSGQEGAVSVLRAPVSGTFSTQADGYELTLTPELLDTLTVSEYLTLGNRRSSVDAGTSIGKLALGFKWYHVILLPEEESLRLKAGQRMTLRFSNAGHSEVAFTVERVSAVENGQAVVVLSTTRSMWEYINSRRMPADLVLQTYTGLRVPRNAIWLDDEAQKFGVYCLNGNQVIFKPVNILTERDNYYLVEFDPLTAKAGDLLPGDEMITEGKDIYDRKVYLQS